MSVAVFRHGWDNGVARDLASSQRRQFRYAEVDIEHVSTHWHFSLMQANIE